jgi:hypothetical protein
VLVRVLNQYVFTWPCLFSDVVIEFCTCFVLHDKRIVIAVNCKFVHHHHYMCLYGKMCGVSSCYWCVLKSWPLNHVTWTWSCDLTLYAMYYYFLVCRLPIWMINVHVSFFSFYKDLLCNNQLVIEFVLSFAIWTRICYRYLKVWHQQ